MVQYLVNKYICQRAIVAGLSMISRSFANFTIVMWT